MSTIRVTFEAPNTDALIQWATNYLTEQGYAVEKLLYPVEKRETPRQLASRLGISASLLSTRLHRPDCPKFQHYPGPSGRSIRWLVASPALESFCQRKTNGGRERSRFCRHHLEP